MLDKNGHIITEDYSGYTLTALQTLQTAMVSELLLEVAGQTDTEEVEFGQENLADLYAVNEELKSRQIIT